MKLTQKKVYRLKLYKVGGTAPCWFSHLKTLDEVTKAVLDYSNRGMLCKVEEENESSAKEKWLLAVKKTD